MRNLIRKILKKRDTPASDISHIKVKNVSDTTNAVFNQYKKSFKDLARYDREGTASVN